MFNLNSMVFTLMLGAVVLGLVAVVIDRINFPQKPFEAKQIPVRKDGPARDRTGAHITDVYVDATTSDPFGEDGTVD